MNITLTAEHDAYWDNGCLLLRAVDTDLADNNIVGEVSLYDHDPLNMRSSFGIEVYPQFRRQGYGALMLRELHTLCRDVLHLHQLYVDVRDTNLVSQHLFEAAGYRHVGLLNDWEHDGYRFHDAYRYQYILN